MKRYARITGIVRRNSRQSTESLAKVGTLALVVFIVAMALMPLTTSSARAANDDDPTKIQNSQLQQVQNGQLQQQGDDPNADASPAATDTPTVTTGKVDPNQVQVDDPP